MKPSLLKPVLSPPVKCLTCGHYDVCLRHSRCSKCFKEIRDGNSNRRKTRESQPFPELVS